MSKPILSARPWCRLAAIANELDSMNKALIALTHAVYVLAAVQRFGPQDCPDVAGVLRQAAAYERAAKELP